MQNSLSGLHRVVQKQQNEQLFYGSKRLVRGGQRRMLAEDWLEMTGRL